MKESVLETLRAMLKRDFSVPESSLRESASLRGDMHLDSLSLVDLVFLVEKDFGIKVGIEDLREAQTLSALADAVLAKVIAKAG